MGEGVFQHSGTAVVPVYVNHTESIHLHRHSASLLQRRWSGDMVWELTYQPWPMIHSYTFPMEVDAGRLWVLLCCSITKTLACGWRIPSSSQALLDPPYRALLHRLCGCAAAGPLEVELVKKWGNIGESFHKKMSFFCWKLLKVFYQF